jgi:hypothetical protein
MNRIIAHAVIGVLRLATPWAAVAGETGMSYDDTVNPGAPPPRIAPPGGGNTPKPLTTNTTPASPQTGATPLQGGMPPREVQPGEETPQVDEQAPSAGRMRPPRGVMLQPGGGDGTQTEDELYVGRKAGGGQVSSGDEDDIEDFQVERRTVQGASTPGVPSKGLTKGLQPGGGDGTQTEDELYVGKKTGDTPKGTLGQHPKATVPGLNSQLQKSANKLTTQPITTPAAKGPGAIVIPRQNCGTHWTTWVADPNADVNPCPTNCERGERQVLNNQKSGNTKQYKARYQCYLPEMVVNQTPEMAKRLEAGAPAKKNCGTFWTGSVDDPNADVNPCPKNCERGELQVVNRNRSGNALQYSMRYQCYMADATPAIKAGKLARGRSLASQSGTAPATGTTEPHPVSGTPQGASIAGGQKAFSTSAVDTAPVASALKRPAAAEREVSTRNIAPGPTLIAVTLEDAITARVSWRPLAGASSYKAHAAAIGLNHSVAGREVKQPVLDGSNQPGLPSAITYALSGLAPGVEHNVWVTVNYPDGRGGTSDLRTVTTSGAENPTGFMAFPIVMPPGSVRLEWQVRPGATHYFVEGSNLPRTQTMNTTFVVPDIRTVGTHEWTVIAVYPGGVYDDRNAPRASVTCALSASSQQVVCSRNRNP